MSTHRRPRRGAARFDLRSDEGSAVAEFALTGALLALVFAGVLQFGLALHVRNTVTDAAVAGARQAALADQSPEDAMRLTGDLITAGVGAGYARNITVRRESAAPEPPGTATLMIIHVRAPVPVLGLLGPATWDISARAPAESKD
ncbi:TadE family protein [Brevibacterium rongguiense]|uniref:TadE family protein n=1 Tax=Brevibacterium rongguiense TaxID=2695267 RepID=UPI002E2926BD|nr:TadE family protein [Brevibacterium rongguiense]